MKEMLIGLTVIAVLVIGYVNMPLQWRRHKDIEHGNALVAKVEQYRAQHRRLPAHDDVATLQQLGFVRHEKIGWQPAYIQLDAQRYEIIYQDGYVAPYLHWQSDKQKWALKP